MTSTRDLHDTLWKAADKLRGSMDAAQYKDFVLGMVFLKYVSDSFAERREQIRAEVLADGVPEERIEAFLDDVDEYRREGVFWVPGTARWNVLAQQSKGGNPGEVIDAAMDAIMKANGTLTGVLPKIFNRDNVDQRRLAELVDLIGDAGFTGHNGKPARDVLGEVYEYFLERFARAEGKRGGEFYTPASVVRLLVEVLEPYSGRVYDPCCGSGGMFVQAEKFVLAHRGRRDDLAVYGQESNERTWRLAKMNLAIHGIGGDLSTRWEDTFREDKHPGIRADFVLANPPFNMSDWALKADDPRRPGNHPDRRHLPRLARHCPGHGGRPEIRGHPRLLLLGHDRGNPRAGPCADSRPLRRRRGSGQRGRRAHRREDRTPHQRAPRLLRPIRPPGADRPYPAGAHRCLSGAKPRSAISSRSEEGTICRSRTGAAGRCRLWEAAA